MITTKIKNTITAEKAVAVTQDFIADQLGNLVGMGRPYHMISGLQSVWSIPLMLTSPGYGIVGIVGAVMVDQEFGHVVGWTPLDEVRANAETLTDEKEAELEAAFQTRHTHYVHSMR